MALDSVPAAKLAGKNAIDAMTYYPERDGAMPALDERATTTSELVAEHLPDTRLVKAFNAILTRDRPDDARVSVPSRVRALPIAGNDKEANRTGAELREAFGFDALDTGPLAQSWRFERAKPAYCSRSTAMGCSGHRPRAALGPARGGLRQPRLATSRRA